MGLISKSDYTALIPNMVKKDLLLKYLLPEVPRERVKVRARQEVRAREQVFQLSARHPSNGRFHWLGSGVLRSVLVCDW